MKTSNILKCLLSSVVVAAAFAAPASATPTYGADTLLGSRNLPNSGDATELGAFQEFVPDLTLLQKSMGNVVATQDPNDSNYWYIDLGTATPGYFLLKFGTGSTGKDDTYFFKNEADLTKLVFSSTDVGGLILGSDCTNGNGNGNGNNSSCNIGRLSHYATGGEGGGDNNGGEVPEPGSLALLGLGVVAMTLRARARGK